MSETSETGSFMSNSEFTVLDIFSGIGGFSLGLERTGGFKTVAFCEIEEYPRKILNKHWPGVPIYEDIRELTKERLETDGIFPNVITGGFPCQDISIAGKQKGINAERSGLWSEFARLIGELRPRYAIVENVSALLSGDRGRWFQRVLGDLAEIGYDAEWHCIRASDVGAWHQRNRVWILCHPDNKSKSIGIVNAQARNVDERKNNDVADTDSGNGKRMYKQSEKQQPGSLRKDVSNASTERLQGRAESETSPEACCPIITRSAIAGAYSENRSNRGIWAAEPELGRVANGIPNRVDRIKGLGNAVVPQVPELIGRAILNAENNKKRGKT